MGSISGICLHYISYYISAILFRSINFSGIGLGVYTLERKKIMHVTATIIT